MAIEHLGPNGQDPNRAVQNAIYSFVHQQEEQEDKIIKVIGVGGGGSQAVRHMYDEGIFGVNFLVINTDKQALQANPVPNKLPIGTGITRGLGAGSKPEVGEQAALESEEEIRQALSDGTCMVFITAGMGGGTGTGASPVIARIAKELGILTVGVVTLPTVSEGPGKLLRGIDGVRTLKQFCDTVIVIPQDKVLETEYKKLGVLQAFKHVDGVLLSAAKNIAEIITREGHPNVDFNDVRTVLENSGSAIMGTGVASGEGRALNAAADALNSPLLNSYDITGARYILIGFFYGDEEVSFEEVHNVGDSIQSITNFSAELKYGLFRDPSLGSELRVSVVATGFAEDDGSYGYNLQTLEESLKRHNIQPQRAVRQPLGHFNQPQPQQAPVQPQYQQPAPQPVVQQQPVTQQPPRVVNNPAQSFQRPQPMVQQPVVAPEPVAPVYHEPVQRPLFQQDVPPAPQHVAAPQLAPQPVQAVAQPVAPPAQETNPKPAPQSSQVKEIVDIHGNQKFLGAANAEDPTQSYFSGQPLDDERLAQRRQEHQMKLEKQRSINQAKQQGAKGINPEISKYMEIPTFKRMDVDLREPESSPAIGRMSLNRDNDLRPNNSFLSDQPD